MRSPGSGWQDNDEARSDIRVYVTPIAGAASLNTASVLDTLAKVDTAWRYLREPQAPPVFDTMAVGIDAMPIRFASGLHLTPQLAAADAPTPDLVVVPGLDEDVADSLQRNCGWVPWIQRWARDGAIVASACTGAFVVAEAGLLDGRAATTHWVAADSFRARYPTVELTVARIVVDTGAVITSGGSTTAFNLVLYLTARFGSAERARVATKAMLLDAGRDSQLPFADMGSRRNHHDQLVHDAQSLIEATPGRSPSVAGLARQLGVSPRTLTRRFGAAIGVSPKAHIAEVRIEVAKRALEQTDESVERIRADSGFLDATSFRRAFKRQVGMSPSEYRRRLGRPPALTGMPLSGAAAADEVHG